MPNLYNFSDVFISYSRRDQNFAQRIGNTLLKQGYEIWADWDDIPQTVDWWDEIKAGIESANVFAFLISPDSAKSDICRDEVAYAVANNKRIIPILHRELSETEMELLHPAIRTHNWMVFENDNDEHFEASLQKLIDVFAMDVEHVRDHTRYLVRAREWDNRNRDKSFVLLGTDSLEAEAWLRNAEGKEPHLTDLHRDYIAFCAEQRIAAEYAQHQRNAIQFVERRTLPAFFIPGFSASVWIWFTLPDTDLVGLDRIIFAFGAAIVAGVLFAGLALYADDLVRLRFPEQAKFRFIASSVYGFCFSTAICGLVQFVNFGNDLHLASIFLAGLIFGAGFVVSTTLDLGGWQSALVSAVGISTSVGLNLGINSSEISVIGIYPVFHAFEFMQYIVIGFPVLAGLALSAYAWLIYEQLRNYLQSQRRLPAGET